jgi:hypothetical protein
MKSQGRDWSCNVVGDCPGKRGRYCILQRIERSLSKEKHDLKKGGNEYITSEIG